MQCPIDCKSQNSFPESKPASCIMEFALSRWYDWQIIEEDVEAVCVCASWGMVWSCWVWHSFHVVTEVSGG